MGEVINQGSRVLCKYPGLEKMSSSARETCTWMDPNVSHPFLPTAGLQPEAVHYRREIPLNQVQIFFICFVRASSPTLTCSSAPLNVQAKGAADTPSSPLSCYTNTKSTLAWKEVNTGKA